MLESLICFSHTENPALEPRALHSFCPLKSDWYVRKMKPECDELSTHYRDETLCCFIALRVDRIHNMHLFMVVYMFLFVGWILGKLCHLLGTNFLWLCDWLIFRLI